MKNSLEHFFDILVAGGGHAGIEAAWMAAQFDLKVGIISLPGIGLASAPCNPAVGGVGKAQLVREIDAMGGLMGRLADIAGIQYRILNASKGPAVQSTRVQIDKDLYSLAAEKMISTVPNIFVIRQKMTKISYSDESFVVVTNEESFRAKKLIVTTGTFLNGKMHTGSKLTSGGRFECDASSGMEEIFSKVKCLSKRFKTGTPPRISRKTIDFSKMREQPSDDSARNMHCLNPRFSRNEKQVSCYLTDTTPETMKIIRQNKEKSPLFNGQIEGIGPRYCPSIEDKAFRYPDRNIHHVFIEPEGVESDSFYPNGLSTSLPLETQEEFLRTLPGLENSKILIPGYAVEYDVIDTSDLMFHMEHRSQEGLYFAGQVNGTSGYEEAAAQGLVAGINASLSLKGKMPLKFHRYDSYIGVLIEDLVTNTRDEPYRLFTARAENRLFIREDNTALRMEPYRKSLGLDFQIDRYLKDFNTEYALLKEICEDSYYSPKMFHVEHLKNLGLAVIPHNGLSLAEAVCKVSSSPIDFLRSECARQGIEFNADTVRAVAISLRYAGYIEKSDKFFEKLRKLDTRELNWKHLVGSGNISFECKQRIDKIKPQTFGELRNIDGLRAATLTYVAGIID